ncbi:MAG TPA: zinc ribbon domain-containing protein [Solirubrobacteraceae bacterium]|nr:zinc ribbon domain-containing protein [Solirubrobacteraceae bacterium]
MPAAPTGADASTVDVTADSGEQSVGFGSRGRARRRARFLRKARELAYRDLGGLVFSLHRFGQRNDALVLAKLGTLSRIDAELRALEANLSERRPVTVLREAGITACPRCAAIHSGEDRFCPNCGLSMSRRSDLPIAGAAATAPPVDAASVPAPAAGPGVAAPALGGFQTVGASAAAPPPTPAPSASPAAATPATQAFDAVAPGAGAGQGGRAPVPPAAPAQAPGEDDQPTEIIRPPAAGS